MAPKTSEGGPFDALSTNQHEGQVQSTPNMGEPAALRNQNPNLNKQLRERIQQPKCASNDVIFLNRKASITMETTQQTSEVQMRCNTTKFYTIELD